MALEVEQKFRVPDGPALLRRLEELGFAADGSTETQVDRYYAHPARDFAETDEALRIRRIGEQNLVTYKGPKLDAQTKTRREIELAVAAGDAAAGQCGELLEALGFRVVAEVRKRRRHATVHWQGQAVEAALDDVDGVGQYAELEIVTNAAGLDTARECVQSLAGRLGLTESERRSYLELLLAGRTSGG